MASQVTVRRQWAPWRTPWIWRRLRSRSKPHRGDLAARPVLFSYRGDSGDVGSFVAGAVNQLIGGSPLNAIESANPGAFLAGQAADAISSGAIDAVLSHAGSGGGGGGGGGGLFDSLGELDEAVAFILAIVAVALLLMVAVPLGILAVEVVFALVALLVGVALRMAHVRPWTILVRQDGMTTAAFSVTGWRSSCRVLFGLRAQQATLAAAPRGFRAPPA